MMATRFWLLGVAAPAAFVGVHFTVMWTLRPEHPGHWYVSEYGPPEIGAMVLFLAAGVAALRLFFRSGRALPYGLHWCWFGYGLASLFVGLEEASYGQHLTGWASPEFFQHTNVQHETNLHNLGGQGPQRAMRNLGEVLLPIWCVVLPGVFIWESDDAYGPGIGPVTSCPGGSWRPPSSWRACCGRCSTGTPSSSATRSPRNSWSFSGPGRRCCWCW